MVVSYPTRATLTVLKSIFQVGGLQLALPGEVSDENQGKRRQLLQLIDGMAVHWNIDRAIQLRNRLRENQRTQIERAGTNPSAGAFNPFRIAPGSQGPFAAGELGSDGLPNATLMQALDGPQQQKVRNEIAEQFALYHHQPQPENFKPSDPDRVLDFHKAISALQSYPALLRALGLVFDLELPKDFLPFSSLGAPIASHTSFGVTSVSPGWGWSLRPAPIPSLMTAYEYLDFGSHRLFMAASRLAPGLGDKSGEILGLLNLDPRDFGLAQVDIDGAMHKTIIVAESAANQAPPLHPEVFDPTSTLPSLRSAGLALVSDGSALALLKGFQGREEIQQRACRRAAAVAAVLCRGSGPRIPARRVGLAQQGLAFAAPARCTLQNPEPEPRQQGRGRFYRACGDRRRAGLRPGANQAISISRKRLRAGLDGASACRQPASTSPEIPIPPRPCRRTIRTTRISIRRIRRPRRSR